MARPRKIRLIRADTGVRYYKPRGIPLHGLFETVLSLDGLEALRRADVEGADQVEAARAMGISRSTFSRLLADARRTVASALVGGWAIRIDGGPVELGTDLCRARARTTKRAAGTLRVSRAKPPASK